MADQNQQPTPEKVQTIAITNFGGRLTRKINGDLNSGFAKFATSYGYDPFSKPDNLTWLENPVEITPSVSGAYTNDLIVAMKPRLEGQAPANQFVYAVGSSHTLYKIQPNVTGNPSTPNYDSTSILGVVGSVAGATYNFGASMDFFYNAAAASVYGTPAIYVGADQSISSVNFDGSNDAQVNSGGVAGNTFRALKQFIGKLYFANGNTVGAIDSTGTVTSSVIGTGQGNLYSELNPPLPINTYVHDLNVSPDGNYLLIAASAVPSEKINAITGDAQSAASSDAGLYLFNGSDVTVTAYNSVPSYAVSAIQTYLNSQIFFANDAFGASLNDGTNKLVTLQNNKSPLPNSTLVNGTFLCWIAPEYTSQGQMVGSLYYYGSLDQENAPGLWRVMRVFSTGIPDSSFIYQTPAHILTNNLYTGVDANKLAVSTTAYGKHYFSAMDVVSSSSTVNRLFYFLITPSGTGSPQQGAYETQTQLFSKKITVKQIRIYCEPTASGNAFELELIGSAGTPMLMNGVGFASYSYAAGTDPTQLQGSLDRINFNPQMESTYALAVKILNTGTVNMCIHKIEVDYAQSGK